MCGVWLLRTITGPKAGPPRFGLPASYRRPNRWARRVLRSSDDRVVAGKKMVEEIRVDSLVTDAISRRY